MSLSSKYIYLKNDTNIYVSKVDKENPEFPLRNPVSNSLKLKLPEGFDYGLVQIDRNNGNAIAKDQDGNFVIKYIKENEIERTEPINL